MSAYRNMLQACMRALPLCVALAGCTKMLPMPLTASQSTPLFDQSEVRVGIAEVDITPPIGLGLFGHGPEARVAVGTQLRLRCQVFVIIGAGTANAPGEAVALVPCDLSSPALLLQRKIAERARTEKVPLGADRILLMATHTHAAPGHYFAVNNYVGPFSSRVLGFDAKVLAFLTQQVSDGLVKAYRSALTTPARIAWWQGNIRTAFTRNREPQALFHDYGVPAWLRNRIAADPLHAADWAVDPTLSVLRIDRREDKGGAVQYVPYGVFATIGMHPSALSNTQDHYSGDAFGYATRYAAQQISASVEGRSKPALTVGIANGIEGDVMPARSATGLRVSRHFGHLIADEIFTRWKELGSSTFDAKAGVRVAYRELSLAGAKTAGGDHMCPRPELGTPAGGGGNDHPTILRVFPQYNPGVTANDTEGYRCSRPKLPILMISKPGTAGVDFPGRAPVTVAQIGTHYLVTLPAELTTMAGVRVREAVASELSLPGETADNVGRSVVVIGLTNEYLQYVATREEYALQFYEGASTLYGPASADFFRDHAACLAHWLAHGDDAACKLDQKSAVNQVCEIKYPKQSDAELMSDAPAETAPTLTLETPSPETSRDGLLAVSVRVAGPAPSVVRTREDLWVELYQVDGSAAHLIEDDRGAAIATRYDSYAKKWVISWLPDLPAQLTQPAQLAQVPNACSQRYYFMVGAGTSRQPSQQFTFDCSGWKPLAKVWP